MDEDNTNELWQEVALQNFDQAIKEHDYSLAVGIMKDTADKGFDVLAAQMNEILGNILGNTPVDNFAIKSNAVWQ